MYLVEAEEANPGEGGDSGEQDNEGPGEALDEPEMDPEESGDGKYFLQWQSLTNFWLLLFFGSSAELEILTSVNTVIYIKLNFICFTIIAVF